MSKKTILATLGSTVAVAGGLVAWSLATAEPAQALANETVTQTVQRAVNFLTPDVVAFQKANGCQACHRQGAALFGLSLAKSRGYVVDQSDTNGLGLLASGAVGRINTSNAGGSGWLHDPGFQLINATSGYSMWGLAGYTAFINTRFTSQLISAAKFMAVRQEANGRWVDDYGSQGGPFPVNFGNVAQTARVVGAMAEAEKSADPASAATIRTAINKAVTYLRGQISNRSTPNGGADGMQYTYLSAYALYALKAAGVANTDADVITLKNRLLSEKASGGQAWGNTSGATADPFNTGMALFALCQAGVRVGDDPVIQNSLNFLKNSQSASGATGGFWSFSSLGTNDIPTTFAQLGLGCFGDTAVAVAPSAGQPTRIQIGSNNANTQTVTFQVDVTNAAAFDSTDTLNIGLVGGQVGWTGSLSRTSISLGDGESSTVDVTITAPANLPQAFPVDWTVIVTSSNNANITASQKLTVFTDPPPPVTGAATTTTLTAGNGVTVSSRVASTRLAATVKDNNNALVLGPGKGVVTFLVAGVAVGSDGDADGNGTYEINWVPGISWAAIGTQDFRAVYSGIDLAVGTDLLSSSGSGLITVSLPADSDSDGIPNDEETAVRGTDPLNPDTDGDGIRDGAEVFTHGCNPLSRDTDGDGADDGVEIELFHTNCSVADGTFPDIDGDGVAGLGDKFPCDPLAAGLAFFPADSQHGMLMFEDNWPQRGDFDYNDVVASYNYQFKLAPNGNVGEIILTTSILAAGAARNNGLAVNLPIAQTAVDTITREAERNGLTTTVNVPFFDEAQPNKNLTVVIMPNVRQAFDTTIAGLNVDTDQINTVEAKPAADVYPITIRIRFKSAVSLNLADAPFDIYSFGSQNTSVQVHLPQFDGGASAERRHFGTFDDGSSTCLRTPATLPGECDDPRYYVDTNGLPFAIHLPAVARWPEEGVQISQVYPTISTFAATGGRSAPDFRNSPVVAKSWEKAFNGPENGPSIHRHAASFALQCE